MYVFILAQMQKDKRRDKAYATTVCLQGLSAECGACLHIYMYIVFQDW